jgi:hypothetical protein
MNLLSQLARLPYVLGLWERFPIGSVATRVHYGIFPYPHYAYGVYWAAVLASRLRIPRISVIEFGVAGGRGLVALEQASAQIERDRGVGIDVVGFDTGDGMPAAADYRDLPHIWASGFYKMDADKLRARLTRARLILGDVGSTTRDWLLGGLRAPIGFVAFDLDYYSSTKAAFALFDGPDVSHLPRVYCYFDDVCSNALACMSEHLGELLAIREFNASHSERKISRVEQVRIHRPRWENWQDRMYAFHNFAHPKYNTLVIPKTDKDTQLPL